MQRLLHIMIVLFLVCCIANSGCKKEYSFEGAEPPVIDTIIVPPPPVPLPAPAICTSCNGYDVTLEGRWSFYNNDTSFYCGTITASAIENFGNQFVIRGPWRCAADTLMELRLNLDATILDHDVFNLSRRNGDFILYDNVSGNSLLESRINAFTVIIESYIHSTRTMTGTFNGPVDDPLGSVSLIKNGKFKVKFP